MNFVRANGTKVKIVVGSRIVARHASGCGESTLTVKGFHFDELICQSLSGAMFTIRREEIVDTA